MIRVAICDDDKVFLKIIELQVSDYFRRIGMEYDLRLFDSASQFWDAFQNSPFNIVILDIIMPELTGIELSRRIYQKTRSCAIAFLTSSPDYAVQGYGVNAVGYLLKPPTREQMDDLLRRCVERYHETRPRSVLFKIGGLTRKVEALAIRYLESRNKQVHVQCGEETLVYSGKLSDIIPQLPANFVQIHKSYIVNLNHIIAMSREEMTCDNGIRLPVSRQYHKDASRRYLDHVASEA